MFLKITGSIIVFMGCTVLGYFFSTTLWARTDELRKIISHLQMFESSITYLSELLYDAFDKISKTGNDAVTNIFRETAYNLAKSETTAAKAWEKAVRDNIGKTSLNKEDESILISFGNMLGKSDLEGQIKNICLTVNQLEMQLAKAEEKRKKSEMMFKRLGVLVGIAIVIILI